MGRRDDSMARRKNKKKNKKQQNRDSSKVSNRIASIIASKKRRKSGKRRICQGMCFSLPTPEDPFNDRHHEQFSVNKRKKPPGLNVDKVHVDKKLISALKDSLKNSLANVDDNKKVLVKHKLENEPITAVVNKMLKNAVKLPKEVTPFVGEIGPDNDDEGLEVVMDTPSKFLIFCLNSIQNALLDENLCDGEKDPPLFANKWGVDYWRFYSIGKDILETSRADFAFEKIAWVASCAADTIARKEKEGLSFGSPFLLFLLPSKEKAVKARQICKPLKTSGIYSVSLHSGASIDHQIQGLRCCEPEFLLSTPARLLELLSSKAVDISGVSLLVIDGCETHPEDNFLDNVKLIRQSISGNPQTVIFNDCTGGMTLPEVKGLLHGPVQILSDDERYHGLEK